MLLIARGAIPHALPVSHNINSILRPRQRDWLWAMLTDKVYGFDTEVTLLKCLTDLNEESYRLVVL